MTNKQSQQWKEEVGKFKAHNCTLTIDQAINGFLNCYNAIERRLSDEPEYLNIASSMWSNWHALLMNYPAFLESQVQQAEERVVNGMIASAEWRIGEIKTELQLKFPPTFGAPENAFKPKPAFQMKLEMEMYCLKNQILELKSKLPPSTSPALGDAGIKT